MVRSQVEWWGGIVNLKALNKNSVRHVIVPRTYRDGDASLTYDERTTRLISPGSTETIEWIIQIPFDLAPVAYPVRFRFGNQVIQKSIMLTPPVEATAIIPNGTRDILRVELRNNTRERQTAALVLDASSGWEVGGDLHRSVAIEPGGAASIDFPCTFAGPWERGQLYAVEVEVLVGEFRAVFRRDLYVAVAHFASGTPALDGTWRGWNVSRPVTIDSSAQISKLLLGNQPWGGGEDLSASVHVMYDKKYLYVGAEVNDDSVVTRWDFPAMSYPWDTDCMEVVLDTRTSTDQWHDPPTPGLFRHLSLAEHRKTEFGPERWRGGGCRRPDPADATSGPWRGNLFYQKGAWL